MTIQFDLAFALAEKISQAATELTLRPVRIFDIGVFPWHKSIELSFLCEGDSEDEADVASWPLYNFSNIYEGDWKSAVPICSVLNKEWNRTLEIIPILKTTAAALKTESVQEAIDQLPQAPIFRIRILNPDDPDSPNYFTTSCRLG